MKKIFIALISIVMLGSVTDAVSQCKVKVKALNGEYSGDCKKKKAHGKGKAVGTDTYEGMFKKGYPDGMGTYTWSNGDVYTGSFKKGKMNGNGTFTWKNGNVYTGEYKKGKKQGKGEMTFSDGSKKIVGYWLKDEYIGTEKTPYKVFRKDPKITSIRFTRGKKDKNEIKVVFRKGSKVVNPGNIRITEMKGQFSTIMQTTQYKVIQSVTYPFKAILSGPMSFEFQITQPGYWEIYVDYR